MDISGIFLLIVGLAIGSGGTAAVLKHSVSGPLRSRADLAMLQRVSEPAVLGITIKTKDVRWQVLRSVGMNMPAEWRAVRNALSRKTDLAVDDEIRDLVRAYFMYSESEKHIALQACKRSTKDNDGYEHLQESAQHLFDCVALELALQDPQEVHATL